MTVNLKEKRELNNFLELLAFSSVKKFYPTAALKYTKVSSLEDVYDFLLDCVESGELKIAWEVKCTNEKMICARKINDIEDKNSILNKEVMCDICGHEFTIAPFDLYPYFKITNEFRDLIREDLKKKTNRLKINMS
ncbi:hypothetical protein [Neobacillus niacini]|uniref:hypothetical protein n=1 Tax=Neobacillus niacini TaxID=86668 RepID=UPI001C8E1098|nr:hypothetical protein [Neobacillus niacini]MBY0145102.1 hypothetical protein [Neobacillus niacini]